MRRLAPLVLLVAACNPQRTAGPAPATSTATPAAGKSAQAFSGPTAPRERGYHYTFRLDPSMAHLDAEVCFVGSVPARLVAPMPEAVPFLQMARGPAGPLPVKDGVVDLAGVEDGACVAYRVDVKALIARKGRREGVARVGDDVMLSPDWWLWAASPREGVSIRARFDERAGLSASVPWPRPGGDFPYTIPETCFDWKAQAVFGDLRQRRLEVGGGSLDVITLGEGGFGDRAPAVGRWLDRSARAAAGLFGRAPVPRGQVLLVPGGGDFGFALQGGGASATLLMGRRPSDAQLAQDWKAVHELLHFGLPPMLTTEAWLYEGLVTYWTALARSRAGMVSESYGWWELLDGFQRGEAAGTGRTLREESRSMHETHAYWRVYWAGAAMALMMDVRLHRERGTSLEAVARSLFGREVAPSGKADDVVAALDAACDCTIASEVASAHLGKPAFPDTASLQRQLGVAIAGEGRAAMDAGAPLAALREAIMAAR